MSGMERSSHHGGLESTCRVFWGEHVVLEPKDGAVTIRVKVPCHRHGILRSAPLSFGFPLLGPVPNSLGNTGDVLLHSRDTCFIFTLHKFSEQSKC